MRVVFLAFIYFSTIVIFVGAPKATSWAIIVAGSYQYGNYRHQADACHAYNILIKHGINEKNIITMMYDDIVNNSLNPIKGKIFNKPDTDDVYAGVKIDYRGKDVSPKVFLSILAGEPLRLANNSSGKAFNPTANDTVFIYLVDHGSVNVFGFPDDVLTSEQLVGGIKSLKKRVHKVLLFVESCESGSLFNHYLNSSDNGILAFTSTTASTPSYGCYFDPKLLTYLGDWFSVNWLENVEKLNPVVETLEQLFTVVNIETEESQIQSYGDKRLMKDVIGVYFGYHQEYTTYSHQKVRNENLVKSHDVQLKQLELALLYTNDPEKHKNILMQIQDYKTVNKILMETMNHIADLYSVMVPEKDFKQKEQDYAHTEDTFLCYRSLIKYFSNNCINIHKYEKVYDYLHIFLNACAAKITVDQSQALIDNACPIN